MEAAQRRLHDAKTEAKRLGVSERHLRRLRSRYGMPWHQVGGLIRFDPDEVDRWLDERRRERRAS